MGKLILRIGTHFLFIFVIMLLFWLGENKNSLFYFGFFLFVGLYIIFSGSGESGEDLYARRKKEKKFIAMKKVNTLLNDILNNSGNDKLMLQRISYCYPKMLSIACGVDTEIKIPEGLEKFHCRSIDL